MNNNRKNKINKMKNKIDRESNNCSNIKKMMKIRINQLI